jgi:hypothetical protein
VENLFLVVEEDGAKRTIAASVKFDVAEGRFYAQ